MAENKLTTVTLALDATHVVAVLSNLAHGTQVVSQGEAEVDQLVGEVGRIGAHHAPNFLTVASHLGGMLVVLAVQALVRPLTPLPPAGSFKETVVPLHAMYVDAEGWGEELRHA
jgi:hypothetical protein